MDTLAKRFSTLKAIIREDLAAMEGYGLLLCRYGGVVLMLQELIGEAAQPVSPYKQAIGRAAITRVREHAWIIVDSGNTIATVIPEPGCKLGLVVMTNSLNVVSALRELEYESVLLMTGGTWDPHSESFWGQVAEQVLCLYDFDQLFIGADSIDLECGMTTFNESLDLSRVMAEIAHEVIVTAEADKAGQRIPSREPPQSSIHTLITDEHLEPSARGGITARGVMLICTPIEP